MQIYILDLILCYNYETTSPQQRTINHEIGPMNSIDYTVHHNVKNIEEKVIKVVFVNKLFIDETSISLSELNKHLS